MTCKLAIIADDLTGANDTGVQFSKQGLATIVLLNLAEFAAVSEADVVVIDTNSRALPAAEAYEKAKEAATLIQTGPFSNIYKKVDSTLRGNLGPEIDAILDTCGQKLALVAPAFPKTGRCTIGGYHLLQNIPLEATEIARDPKAPVLESYVPGLLKQQTRRAVGHIGIKTLLAGREAVSDALRQAIRDKQEIVVCDIWADEQFQTVAEAAVQLGEDILWVGSAGLAECLPAVLGMKAAGAKKQPVVVIAGSVSAVTRRQVDKLKQNGVYGIEMDAAALLSDDSSEGEIGRCMQLASEILQAGEDVVITSGFSDEAVAKARIAGQARGLDGIKTGEAVAAALGELGKRLAQGGLSAGLVLTGGDTAVSVCNALGALGVVVTSEVAPGIPLGVLKGGLCDGIPVVTKAGAFGSDDALLKAVLRLKK